MDIALIVIGALMAAAGGRMRDENGHRSGGGIALLAVGITIAVIGAIIFTLAFIGGWMGSAYN